MTYLSKDIYGNAEAITHAVGDNGYRYAIGIPKEISGHLQHLDGSTTLSVYYVYSDSGAFTSMSSVTAASMV